MLENDHFKQDKIVNKCRIISNFYDELNQSFRNAFDDLKSIDFRDTCKFYKWHEKAKREIKNISEADSQNQAEVGTVTKKFKDDLLNSLLLNEANNELYECYNEYKDNEEFKECLLACLTNLADLCYNLKDTFGAFGTGILTRFEDNQDQWDKSTLFAIYMKHTD